MHNVRLTASMIVIPPDLNAGPAKRCAVRPRKARAREKQNVRLWNGPASPPLCSGSPARSHTSPSATRTSPRWELEPTPAPPRMTPSCRERKPLEERGVLARAHVPGTQHDPFQYRTSHATAPNAEGMLPAPVFSVMASSTCWNVWLQQTACQCRADHRNR
eukprot:909388-Rhodomonas_salina.1